jgi:recombinational DNA repair protein RecT
MAEALPHRSYAAQPISPGHFLFVFKLHKTLYVTPNVDESESMTRACAIKAFADTNRRIECMSQPRVHSPTKKKIGLSDVEPVWDSEED